MADRFPIIIESTEQQIQELSAGDGLDLTRSGVVNANYVHSAGVNAGVVTATSFIGDGSQITNIPAGGGSLEATASGTLSDGSTVLVNADGTVSVVAQTETTGSGAGSEVVFESVSTYGHAATFDSTNNKVVVAYRNNSNYGTAIVGTVSGNSISFGTPTVFESATADYISATFDSTNGKVVIAYVDSGNSNYGTVVVGTVSGTSISFGSPVVFASANVANYISATFDSTNEKVVISYTDNSNSNRGTSIVGTVSGTSISFGSAVVFSSTATYSIASAFDSANGKIVIVYQDNGNSAYATAIVGTVSGTSISFGSSAVFASIQPDYPGVVYDSSNQKMVILYADTTNSNYGTVIVATVSGNSISFGSPVVFSGSSRANYIKSTFDSTNNKIVISYQDSGNNYYGTVVSGAVSGNSISFGTPVVFNTGNTQPPDITFDSSNGKAVIAYRDHDNSGYGTAAVFSETGFPAPQLGSSTVFESGGTIWISSTFDSSNGKVVIAYSDNGNSNYGTAVVGTVSGTSISFDTPVVFNSASSARISSVYDSANEKVVISYRDEGNSSQGTAIVGTVSGTSISFGSSAVFESGNTRETFVTYDSTNGKVVIVCRDQGNNDYGTAIVGTVSGTSISFGSPTVFASSGISEPSATFDPSNGKVVIAYRDDAPNYYGKAVVGTVSGNSISFGSLVTFESYSTSNISATYDPNNQKVVLAYQDAQTGYGTGIVGTVSGTSISFGTPAVWNSSSTSNVSAVYDSTTQKVVIAYRDHGNSDRGTLVVGTVSGTSISFGSPFVFNSAGQTSYNTLVFDSGNGKVIISYQDGGNGYVGTSVVFSPATISNNLTAENYIGISDGAYSNGQTATIQIAGSVDDAQSGLTPGQQYYVQNDGTLSETADSPSVLAGTAVAATKLMIG